MVNQKICRFTLFQAWYRYVKEYQLDENTFFWQAYKQTLIQIYLFCDKKFL
jgi:hypothetical protein